MKIFFKLILLSAIVLMNLCASAQDKPFTFGVKAGVNLANFSGDVENNKAKIGYNVGVTVDYAITPEFYLLSGLEFTTKGVKWKAGDDEQKANPMYLQVPVHAGYKIKITEGTRLMLHAGPYVAYGIGGKNSIKENGKEIAKYNFFGDKESGRAKRFDFGLGLGVGVEFGKINAGLGWDFGLLNFSRAENNKLRNMNGYLTVGYKF